MSMAGSTARCGGRWCFLMGTPSDSSSATKRSFLMALCQGQGSLYPARRQISAPDMVRFSGCWTTSSNRCCHLGGFCISPRNEYTVSGGYAKTPYICGREELSRLLFLEEPQERCMHQASLIHCAAIQ